MSGTPRGSAGPTAGPTADATRRLVILSIGNVVMLSGVTVIFPLLARLQDEHGLTTAQLGLMSGASFLAGLIVQLGLARYVDRGHARSMLIAAVVLVSFSLAWLAVATELWHFVAARFVEGTGYGLFAPAARSVVARGDPTRVGTNLGRLSAAELAGVVIGPLLGAGLGQLGGTSFPFACVAVATLVLVPLLVRLPLPDFTPATAVAAGATDPLDPGGGTASTSVRSLWRRPAVRRAAIVYLALYLPTGVYDVLWARYLTDLGAGEVFIGVSFAIYGIPYVAVAPFGGKLVDRIGAVPVTFGALVATLPFIVAYGLASIPLVVASFAMGEAAANAVSIPAAQAAMVDACHADEVGAGQGLAGAMGIGGAGLASLIAAPLYEHAGAEATFLALAATMVALAAVAWLAGGGLSARRAGASR